MSHVGEVRYYKGKWRVRVEAQSLGNWLVEALEPINDGIFSCPRGHQFMTYLLFLHRKPRHKRFNHMQTVLDSFT